MTAPEEWRTVESHPDYMVSNTGLVVSHKADKPREMRGAMVGGYRRVNLRNADGLISLAVHRLVAVAFHGPCPDGQEVRHLDGDKTNNNASNLRFGTRAENVQDMLDHGTHPMASRTHCKNQHEFTPDNVYLRRGTRYCRTCRRQWNRESKIRATFAAANVREVAA